MKYTIRYNCNSNCEKSFELRSEQRTDFLIKKVDKEAFILLFNVSCPLKHCESKFVTLSGGGSERLKRLKFGALDGDNTSKKKIHTTARHK